MEFEFSDSHLEGIYFDPAMTLGHGALVDKGFRKVIGSIRAAHTELDLRALKSLHYHKLDGDRKHQHALDISAQWRLIVERYEQNSQTKLLIISVEDYH